MAKLDVKNLDKVMKRFANISDKVKNPNKAMQTIAMKAWGNVINHFDKELGENESGDAVRWKPLKFPRERGGTKMLQDTGRLRYSNRYYSNDKQAVVANNCNYAAIHNFGGKIKVTPKMRIFLHAKKGIHLSKDKKEINIPMRKFLWLDDKMKEEIDKYFLSYIVEK